MWKLFPFQQGSTLLRYLNPGIPSGMGIRALLAPNEIYHLYNRGTEKRNVFLNKGDYERFTALLYLSNSTKPIRIDNLKQQGRTLLELLAEERGELLVDITAYCLMPNHFHLLVRQQKDGGISKFMQKLVTGYTMYFNKKYERTGALFQGKYKSKHAGEDKYLKYLMSYIHLNPSKLIDDSARFDLAGTLETYSYSSYAEYAGIERPEAKLLTKEALPLYFPTPEDFKRELNEWQSYHDEVTNA